jgi:glycosyltransferase involved in cell wall biosynthesis
MYDNYSVLLCVYAKEKADNFSSSVSSIVNQSLPTNDFVIVCDGPLSQELDAVIEKYQSQNPKMIHVLRLPENVGPGRAAHEGFKICQNEIVARMDSDDIAMPNRMKLELARINEGYDVVGGAIEEFNSDPNQIIAIKYQPEKHEEIVKLSKKRNPINHVTIMYKKSMVNAVGGYNNFRLGEDYSLVISLIMYGAKCSNIQESAVKVRMGDGQVSRRSGKLLRHNLHELRKMMYKKHYITFMQYHKYNFETNVFTLMPNWLRKWMYKHVLRQRKQEK